MTSDNVRPFPARRPRRREPPPPPPGGWPEWRERLSTDDRGRIISDLDNVLFALRAAEEMRFACSFDEMLQHSLVTRQWPKVPEYDAEDRPVPHEVDDDDITRLQQWLQRMGIRRIGREVVGQAVEHFARDRRHHPVRDYLDNLVWDGAPRLATWLFSYLGASAENNDEIEYVRFVSRMFPISMVARVYDPGCQADYMMVLEGEQGTLKSTACRVLAGEWFSDSLPENISGKDARQHLRGKWLMEVSELAAFSKTEVEALKAFITRREEKYRPPFGRHDVAEKRQCVFVGTTNQEVYIKDATGGRRFWPVKCNVIDVPGLTQVRDQLFAEAVVAYRRKDRYWPTAEDEAAFFKPQQDKRQEDDPWKHEIARHLQTTMLDRVTATQVAKECLGFDGASRIGAAEGRRIASVFRELGWIREHGKHGSFYKRPMESGDS